MRSRWERGSEGKDNEVSDCKDNSNIKVAIANRGAYDANCPDAGCRGVAGGEIALSDDGARTDIAVWTKPQLNRVQLETQSFVALASGTDQPSGLLGHE